MKTKISKQLIALLIVTLTTVYASNHISTTNTQLDVQNFKNMSTTELQIEVEKLSNQGNLPAEMGFELMKRWTETKKEIN